MNARAAIQNQQVNDRWIEMEPLSEIDRAFCKMIAGLRTMAAKARNAERPFLARDRQDMVEIEERGVIAEFAFCRHINVFPDFTVGQKDRGYDCFTEFAGNHTRINVKSIGNPSHGLAIEPDPRKSENTDVFVVVYVEGSRTWITGWLERDAALQEKYKARFKTECFLVPGEDLHDWIEQSHAT